MYEYIKGALTSLTPTCAVVEAAGIGYFVNISLQTYTRLADSREAQLYLHQQVREDAHVLYGFADADERELFRMLISVSGVGAATARIMLSSLNSGDLTTAISTGDVAVLKSIKGIGLKTAERIVVDLKGKSLKAVGAGEAGLPGVAVASGVRKEATAALLALGFPKAATEKAVEAVFTQNNRQSVEELIRGALQRL
ncbi:MAG: Holliday junction branch migration protein RuvA [Prevotellaceae bacterium]|jgi:Holliday junction DNA helicase RuvA|nr:Holliday junction branch migration protein RuvA [Prevotellaceae bacterium]